MAKRFPHQRFRSYRTYGWGSTWEDDLRNRPHREEIQAHVRNTCRCDADPIFNELAHTAAMNGINHGYTGEQGVSFTQPTTNPSGYFAILRYIIKNPKCTKRDIDEFFGATIITTVDRLFAGRLIQAEQLRSKKTNRMASHFSATDLGKAYFTAASRYLGERKS